MRVLWVTKGLGPGGAERLLTATSRALDPDVVVECAYVLPWKDHVAAELEAAGVRTRCLSRRRSDASWPLRLARLVRHGAYDVVHVHSPLPGSVARLAVRSVPAVRRPALVTTEHNRWATHRLPTRFLNRLTIRWDDATFCVTDEVRESMSSSARSRARTLRHGIDVATIGAARSGRERIRSEIGLDPAAFVVGTVANFRPQKDHPNLLHAARLVIAERPDVRFVVVGQGPQEEEIRGLRDRLGLGEAVLLTGFRADAIDVVGACDAFVLASRWEGLPVAVMEACALGLPIVATAVGGVAEELTDGVDALLVPPADPEALAAAIGRLVDDPALAARLGTSAQEKAADFDVSAATATIEATYRRLVFERARPFDAATVDRCRRHEPGGPVPTGRPTMPSGVEIRPANPDDRPAIVDLLARSLGADGDPRYPDLVAWKHDRNPFGPSPMWVAVESGRLLAVRAFLRWEFVRGGRVVRAVRAVDTATDPEARGRGLFRALTLHGLEALADDGVDFVFNTPNEQSRPGYLSMGWREIGALPSSIAPAGVRGARRAIRARVPADRWSFPLAVGEPAAWWLDRHGGEALAPPPGDVRRLTTNRTPDYLRWRYGSELLGYRVVADDRATIIVRARRRGPTGELVVAEPGGDLHATDALARRVARETGCDHVLRLGPADLRHGFVPLPGGGPMLTWRAVTDAGPPPLPNWALVLGDVELF